MSTVPRYSEFTPASAEASSLKKRVRRTNTTPERVLRRKLWSRGLRYRLHSRDLPGKPDIVFRGRRIAVFCDGDFWHGKNWQVRREKLESGANPAYWIAKIEANMTRDREQAAALENEGWVVLRFWESDILKNTDAVADRIAAALERTSELRCNAPR